MKNFIRLFFCLEMLVCFGPTYIFLMVGLILLPHQIFFIYAINRKGNLEEEAMEKSMHDSLVVIGYFIGAYIAAFIVTKLIISLFSNLKNRKTTKLEDTLLLFGILALIFGPYGILSPHGIEMFSIASLIFSTLPIIGIIHLWILVNHPSTMSNCNV